MSAQTAPRRRLAFLPTPLVEAPRFAEVLGGPAIWFKRDDQTGLAVGGNKTRKLEYLVADALARGADTLVTAGAAQSNHCRQTAAAAAAAGLDCHLVLGGEPPATPNGNLLLDRLLGAHLDWAGERRKGEDIPAVVESLQRAGRAPYAVPYGGSNAVGALGFVHAAGELAAQCAESGHTFDRIIFASSSGGTQAGLVAGKRYHGLAGEPVGIRIDKEDGRVPFARAVAELAATVAQDLGVDAAFDERDLGLVEDYAGTYGAVGDAEREAVRLVARTEGILLDPVYTGRAMAGLIDGIRRGHYRPDERILFWHTGGTPALFADPDALLVGESG